ncbi:HU family DNA-binding protein [Roseobacter ponti]|uniref:DNA-binding protein n=1 Tax=Roseobacter ponti TaxID=1891787 RepID=A0A858SRY3_9RHOB|nr:HU family DNA-binding protein [Roseobacter ponti]QJF51435.1 DNA-binding protein [Roseobacter ponti]
MALAGKTTKKRTPRKTVTKPTTTSKPKAVATVETTADDIKVAPELRKKELIEKVVLRSGIRKRDAKPVIEAMLEELGMAVGEGRGLVLPPMGRLKIIRQKDTANGQVTVIRARRKAPVVVGLPEPVSD